MTIKNLSSPKIFISVILISGLILTATILLVRAGGPFLAYEGEDSQVSSQAEIKNSSSASGGSYVEFTQPTVVDPPPTASCSGTNVPAGANIASAVSAAPSGATLCLSPGTYVVSSVIWPKTGQKIVGALDNNGNRLSILTGNNTYPRAFQTNSSTGVELRNIIIEKFKPGAQQSPLSLAVGWLIDYVESRYNYGTGMSTGNGTVLRNSYIHHNHQMGIGGQGGAVVENNEIAYNNWLGEYDWGWEAGGAKWVNHDGLIVRGNYSHNNCGPGLWTDGPGNKNILYENNRVENNFGPGIMHEIGYSAVIRGNTVTGNAWGTARVDCPNQSINGYRGGILISESNPVEVVGNIIKDNKGGVVAIDNERGTNLYVKNLYVHNNEIWNSGTDITASGCYDFGATYDCFNNNNRWENNKYYVGSTSRPFYWNRADRTWAEWQSFGFDLSGSLN